MSQPEPIIFARVPRELHDRVKACAAYDHHKSIRQFTTEALTMACEYFEEEMRAITLNPDLEKMQ